MASKTIPHLLEDQLAALDLGDEVYCVHSVRGYVLTDGWVTDWLTLRDDGKLIHDGTFVLSPSAWDSILEFIAGRSDKPCAILSVTIHNELVRFVDYASGRPLVTLLLLKEGDYSGLGCFYSFLWALGEALNREPTL